MSLRIPGLLIVILMIPCQIINKKLMSKFSQEFENDLFNNIFLIIFNHSKVFIGIFCACAILSRKEKLS